MRTLLPFLLSVTYILPVFSQSIPSDFKYQGVARDNAGGVIVNTALSVRLGIESGSPGGTLEWEETHAVTTNSFGLFNLFIGTGTSTGSGNLSSFTEIDWGSNPFWLKTEIDLGSGYTYMGTSSFSSVPYAHTSQKVIDAPEMNFSDLSDVDTTGLAAGYALQWNGSAWVTVNQTTLGDDWGTQIVQSDATLQGIGTSGDLLGLAPLGLQEAYDHQGSAPGAGNYVDAANGSISIFSANNTPLSIQSQADEAFGAGISIISHHDHGIIVNTLNETGIFAQSLSGDPNHAALELYGKDSVQNASALKITKGGVSVSATGDQFVGVINVIPGAWQQLTSSTDGCSGCYHDHNVVAYQDVTFNNIYIDEDNSVIFLTVESIDLTYTAQVRSKLDGTAIIRLIHVGELPPLVPTPLKINYMIINKI